MQTHFWKYYCPWYITVSMYYIVILWNIISRFFCQMTIIFFVRNSAILWWRSQLYVWPSRASSRVPLNYSRLHLTCAKFMQNFASQYLIPQQCTFPNINWVLLFKTGKIFRKLVQNLAGWFFFTSNPDLKLSLHSPYPLNTQRSCVEFTIL